MFLVFIQYLFNSFIERTYVQFLELTLEGRDYVYRIEFALPLER